MSQFEWIVHVLQEEGVRCWLDSGTLLGMVRDGKLIDSDPDIDLAVWEEEEPKLRGMAKVFRAAGYAVRSEAYGELLFNFTLIPRFRSGRRRIDICVYRRAGGHAWAPALLPATRDPGTSPQPLSPRRIWWLALHAVWARVVSHVDVRSRPWEGFFRVKTWWIPEDCFAATEVHSGSGCPVPEDWSRYLTLRYGDWKTPVKSWSYWVDDGGLAAVPPEDLILLPDSK